jgi:hypothetical protein
MAHLSLQIGATIVVPIASSREQRRRIAWRRRALREVASDQGPMAAWPAAQLREPRAHGFKLRRMPQLGTAVELW